MKRYSLGSTPQVDNFINTFNLKFAGSYFVSPVSGITMGRNNQFTAIVEYFELENDDEIPYSTAYNLCPASVELSYLLNIPMYFIFYKNNWTFFTIYNFQDGTHFSKSILNNQFGHCDFIDWWLSLKGTIQTKKFYKKAEYISWKINQVLDSYGLKWGGDIDGILMDNQRNILGIIEFRKSSYKSVDSYDPASFYKGTDYRKGDYLTWYPLTQLSNQIGKKLILITLSLIEPTKCGITVVDSNDKDALYYANDIKPTENTFNSYNVAFDDLIKIINDYVNWLNSK